MTKEHRGGKREGAGRKKATRDYSEEIRKDVMSSLKRKSKETGQSFGDVLCELFWTGDKKQPQLRATAAKIIQEVLVIKETHSTVEKHDYAPAIGLPPIKEPENKSLIPTIPPKEFVN